MFPILLFPYTRKAFIIITTKMINVGYNQSNTFSHRPFSSPLLLLTIRNSSTTLLISIFTIGFNRAGISCASILGNSLVIGLHTFNQFIRGILVCTRKLSLISNFKSGKISIVGPNAAQPIWISTIVIGGWISTTPCCCPLQI